MAQPVEGSNPFLTATESRPPLSRPASPLARIADLAALLAETGLSTLELSGPGGSVVLHRSGAGAPARPGEAPAAASGMCVVSPGIGQFLGAHPLHEEPLAEEGAEVAAGDVLALLRIGALLLPVRAPVAGRLLAAHRAEGALTGYGDPLVDILPET